MLNGCPGDLIITSGRLRFAPTRGFQKLGLKKLANRLAVHGEHDRAGGAAMQLELDLDIPMGEVVGVKKDKRLGFEGLVITARDGQVSCGAWTWRRAPGRAAGQHRHRDRAD
jgi:hypothetical protein